MTLIDHVNGVRRLRTTATNWPTIHPPSFMWVWRAMWWCWLGRTPDSSTRALRQFYQQRHLGASRRNGRSGNLAYWYLRYVNRSLICRKILQHGAYGFTSHPKEGMLWIFVALKNPSPQPGLNPRPLGPVESTLTTTPPRQQCST
jgi:hypothetical protein